MDFVETLSVIIPAIIMSASSKDLRGELKFKYNYGVEKIEAVAAYGCEIFDLMGLGCIFTLSVIKLTNGTENETHHLAFAIIMKSIGFILDVIILYREKHMLEKKESRLLHTAFISATKELIYDVISIITITVTLLISTKQTVDYISPLVCIVVAIPMSLVLIKHIREAFIDLIDITLDEESQILILKILTEYFEQYDTIGEIKSRKTASTVNIDIEVGFSNDKNYEYIKNTVTSMRNRLAEEFEEECVINFIII